jgi:hypothetical protein
LFLYIEKASKHGFDSNKRLKTPVFVLMCILILLLPGTYLVFYITYGDITDKSYNALELFRLLYGLFILWLNDILGDALIIYC